MRLLRGILEALFWIIAAAVLIGAVMVLVGFGVLPVLSYGGVVVLLLFFPLVLRLVQVMRRRRSGSILAYLEQAVRLNLPLSRMTEAAQRSEEGFLADRLATLTRQLDAGTAIGTALRVAVPEIGAGPPAMIEAAERLGRLPHALKRLVQKAAARSEYDMTDALFFRAYPFMMTICIGGAISLFAIFVMPKFETIFRDFGLKLPPITWATLEIAGAIGPFALGIAILFMLGWAGSSLWKIVHPASAEWSPLHALRDRLVWWTPYLHGMAHDSGMADALDLIAEALRAGQPLDRATAEAAQLRINVVLRSRFADWSRRLTVGEQIGNAARGSLMPGLLVEMLATARSGDQAADVIDFVARYYESRFSRTRTVLRAAAVPLMVLFFASLVFCVAVTVLLPMASMINNLSNPATHWKP